MTCEGCRAYILQKNASAVGFPETKLRLEAKADAVCLTLIRLGVCQIMAASPTLRRVAWPIMPPLQIENAITGRAAEIAI